MALMGFFETEYQMAGPRSNLSSVVALSFSSIRNSVSATFLFLATVVIARVSVLNIALRSFVSSAKYFRCPPDSNRRVRQGERPVTEGH